jgi:hypothetical protein
VPFRNPTFTKTGSKTVQCHSAGFWSRFGTPFRTFWTQNFEVSTPKMCQNLTHFFGVRFARISGSTFGVQAPSSGLPVLDPKFTPSGPGSGGVGTPCFGGSHPRSGCQTRVRRGRNRGPGIDPSGPGSGPRIRGFRPPPDPGPDPVRRGPTPPDPGPEGSEPPDPGVPNRACSGRVVRPPQTRSG